MNKMTSVTLQVTDSAINRVKTLIANESNPNLKLRIYITGGGCSGFQYGFIFDDKIQDGDFAIEKQGITLLVDCMSLQYLTGGLIDYNEDLKGARFIVINPNIKTTCSCGFSFDV